MSDVLWDEGIAKKEYPKLEGSVSAEVVVVGGGLAGVLAAYLLSKNGKKVVLLEKNRIGEGATGVTTAFLTQSLDTDPSDLLRMLGEGGARLVYKSHENAIDLIEFISKEEGIECEFKRCSDYIYGVSSETEIGDLKKEFEIFSRLGLGVQLKNDEKLLINNSGYIELLNQAKFHPLKFLNALANKTTGYGARFYEQAEAVKIYQNGKKVTVETNEGLVEADWGIVATYAPFNKPLGLYFKKGMYTSYILVMEIPKSYMVEGIYEDTMNPYHYFRVDKFSDFDRVILGGEDHRSQIKMNPSKNFKALEDYFKLTFGIQNYDVTHRWSGPILEPVDGLAFIGPASSKDKILYAMAFSGNGMTYSAISATILTDIILGKENEWYKIYRANRVPNVKSLLIKGRDFTEELIRGAVKNFFKYRK